MNGLRRALIVFGVLCVGGLVAQSDKDVVFSVDDDGVPVSEFRYIYEKNNRDQADYSEESVQEYLDLYVKFKLKVRLAREMQLDTISALNKELEGYRRQLAKTYLIDKNVTDKLVEEAYNRMKEDVRVSHILFQFNGNPESKTRALDHAEFVFGELKSGKAFEELARQHSHDKASAAKGGDIGFITAMLPTGFYGFESVAYNLQPGEYAQPVESKLGYHIIMVTERRPARGKVEISHILSRVKEDQSNENTARMKIDAAYSKLQNGESFDKLAASISDDEKTARRKGYIGKVGIGRFDPAFEEVAFSLEKGQYSEPVRSRIGWHIIKVINHVEFGSLDDERKQIEARLTGSDRNDIARESMMQQLKEESGYRLNEPALEEILSGLGDDFLSFQWEAPEYQEKTLIELPVATRTNTEFLDYLKGQARTRMRNQGVQTPREVAMNLFGDFLGRSAHRIW